MILKGIGIESLWKSMVKGKIYYETQTEKLLGLSLKRSRSKLLPDKNEEALIYRVQPPVLG
jgi:hypothetical protein